MWVEIFFLNKREYGSPNNEFPWVLKESEKNSLGFPDFYKNWQFFQVFQVFQGLSEPCYREYFLRDRMKKRKEFFSNLVTQMVWIDQVDIILSFKLSLNVDVIFAHWNSSWFSVIFSFLFKELNFNFLGTSVYSFGLFSFYFTAKVVNNYQKMTLENNFLLFFPVFL